MKWIYFSINRPRPIVFTKNNEKVAYSTLTATLATSALDMIKYKLRGLHNPNERLASFLKEWPSENIHRLNGTPFDEIKKDFIDKFSDTLRSLDRTQEWRGKSYFVKFESHDRMERKYFSYRELALRPLSCLLIASPHIDDEGRKIVQEVLKDKEVLEIIKLQFSSITANHEFERDLYLDFKDYLMHNSWSKGIANIFNELSEKDQHDVFNSSLDNYVKFYNYVNVVEYRKLPNFADIYQVFDFFEEPQALNKLSNLEQLSNSDQELAVEVGRTLINIVSVPEYLDHPYENSGIWAFAYYVVEFLVKNQNSIFFKLYQDKIHNDSLIEKIDFLKHCIALKKRANELLPSKPIIRSGKKSKVWEQLGEDSIVQWFNQYFEKLKQLDIELKEQSKQFEIHLKAYKIFKSEMDLYNNFPKESISSKLGGLLSTKLIKQFLTNDDVTLNSEINKHKSVLKKAGFSGLKNNGVILVGKYFS
ncbi:hypothetical protein PPACK8108_LOCUS3011 [Phakopsora pachyrhizi]|uniref:Uncharacterized protein n=1 Tax=Phakopsora pachyrhizi TaxID=170000 RepID=A0AAV0AJ46_PHAPC|nr:hypothetical protein PPACK8108_LOCUS3011 [Phakopsora pachyrhizi]